MFGSTMKGIRPRRLTPGRRKPRTHHHGIRYRRVLLAGWTNAKPPHAFATDERQDRWFTGEPQRNSVFCRTPSAFRRFKPEVFRYDS